MGGKPSKPEPGKKLQVIAAGYSRTGTVAIQLAVETLLSGPVLHGGTAILGREDAHCRLWVEAYRAKRAGDFDKTCELIRELTDGFVGVSDMPPLDFIPELMAVYPGARVLLTTRDPDAWLESIRPVARNSSQWWLPYGMAVVPGWRWFPSLVREFGRSCKIILGMKEDEGPANPPPCKELLHNWNEGVKAMVPPEKLLVMNLKEGWEPLCKFLDVPVPEEPLPRANDSAAAAQAAQDVAEQVIRIWIGIASVSTIVGFSAFKFWRSR